MVFQRHWRLYVRFQDCTDLLLNLKSLTRTTRVILISSTAKIEILSGAFMWMRAEALKEVGVLDEAFMYGEDIDLSWRIVKGLGESLLFSNPNHHYKEKALRREP